MKKMNPQLMKSIKKQKFDLSISIKKHEIVTRYTKYGLLSHVLMCASLLSLQIFDIVGWWASIFLIVSAFLNNYIFRKVGQYVAEQYEIDKRIGIL